MTQERPRLGDNPSWETRAALTEQALENYIFNTRDILNRMEKKIDAALTLAAQVEKIQEWMNLHDRWHGADDEHLVKRILPSIGWKLIGGGIIFGAALATIVGIVVQVTLNLS